MEHERAEELQYKEEEYHYTADMCERDAIAEYKDNGLETLVGPLDGFIKRRLLESGF